MSDPILASVFCDNHCDMLAEDIQHNSDLNGAVPPTAELHQYARTRTVRSNACSNVYQ